MRVVIRGAGDLATGVALRLRRAGMEVVMCERETPLAIRRTVAMSEAVRRGEARVEDVRGVFCADDAAVLQALSVGDVAVVVDPDCACATRLHADAVVDAILAKRNCGTTITMAPIVIALGPGFAAGIDCHAVVETLRGHDLGRVFYLEGARAKADTRTPGDMLGHGAGRVMYTPCAGKYEPVCSIGDKVRAGDVVAYVEGMPVRSAIGGVLRGQLPAIAVEQGVKCADVDPRGVRLYCFTVSDRARSLGGAVLEALLCLQKEKM